MRLITWQTSLRAARLEFTVRQLQSGLVGLGIVSEESTRTADQRKDHHNVEVRSLFYLIILVKHQHTTKPWQLLVIDHFKAKQVNI